MKARTGSSFTFLTEERHSARAPSPTSGGSRRHASRSKPRLLQGDDEMNQEQFGQFWAQLKSPLRTKWEKITEGDVAEIQGLLTKFQSVVHQRYGESQKEDVYTWANRRYSHWSGNYAGYKDIESAR
jgi:hypothetical protein